jgi:hypothetical protein
MKSINEVPVKKKGRDKKKLSPTESNPEKKGVYSDIDSDESRNYMEGDDDVNGPEWDKSSIEVDGDTSQNAGVFK